MVSSYIPIRNRGSNKPEAVFEVYSDVTDLLDQMRHVQWKIVIGVLGSIAIIYVLLLAIARRVDRIDAERREESARSAALIRHQAHHDLVTGLPNRLSFQENLAMGIERAERHKRMLGVMFLDVDRFKLVNDSFGHDAGDELLRQTAGRLRYCVRQSDTLFRMGVTSSRSCPKA